MKAIVAFVAASISDFAELYGVLTISAGKQADEWVLYAEPRIVCIGQNRAVRIKNRQTRIQWAAAKAHAFDLDREALAFFRLYGKAIDVLVVDDAINGGVEIYLLRMRWIVIRLLFRGFRKRADEKRCQLRETCGGANAQ